MIYKFTPAPWKRDNQDPTLILGFDGYDIAGVSTRIDNGDDSEMEANARLIAASPELYSALHNLEAEISLSYHNNPRLVALIEAARKALEGVE